MTSYRFGEAPARGGLVIGVSAVLVAGMALLGAPGTATDSVGGQPQRTADLDFFINQAMGLAQSELVQIDVDPTPGIAHQIGLSLGGVMYSLGLQPSSVLADDHHVYLSDGDGNLTEVEPAPERTYRGVVLDDPGSLVAAGVDESGLHARIILSDKSEYWVEPVAPLLAGLIDADLSGLHVVYSSGDVLPTDKRCGTVGNVAHEVQQLLGSGGSEGDGGGGGDPLYFTEIAFDVDFFYFEDWGEAGSQQRINFIVNSGLNIQYPRDVEISYEVTTFIIRTSQVYTAATLGGLLDQFRLRWLQNHGDVIRDVAELFTGQNLSGNIIGVAYFNGICTTNGFNVVENLGNFSCRTDLSAHELGHNWNADHCNCAGFTMASSLGCVNVFHPTFTIPELISYRNSRNCLDIENERPPNDDCGQATLALNGTFPFDTTNATTDGAADCNGQIENDIWYNVFAACDGVLTASLCGTSFDTKIAIYDGHGCVGELLACNDDACGDQSEVSINVTQAQQVKVRVGGAGTGGVGAVVFSCEAVAECPEDLDDSGAVDFGDILAILAAWGNAGGPEDLDDSGFVDFGDILEVLGHWGPCP